MASAAGGEQQVCDVRADYALGVEDYTEAIRLHAEVLRKHPENALAHYHLGFAEGIMGNRTAEVREYQRAAALGLEDWDLFLNLGLAQLEIGDLDAATDSLCRAVLLGENHSESHFNLALVYERRGMLADAEREMLASLQLNPGQPDGRNLLGVIYDQEGKTVRASVVWRELVREVPDYEPARTNLGLLGIQNEVARGETAAVVSPPAAAVKGIEDERKLPGQMRETELVLVPAQQKGKVNRMSALVQTKPSRFASFKAIVSLPRPRLVPATVVSAREPRAFPGASTPPTLHLSIRDEMLEYYAFIFCQGGFRPLDMTFEQFLLVAAAIKPADLPVTREEARTL
jgi:Flp pilus assembly protein TadD